MRYLIKADFKKTFNLKKNRNYVIILGVLSIFFSLTFLFTLNVTQKKQIIDLSSIELLDVSLLGMDVVTIMLVIFFANFIAKEFTTEQVYTSLAITPLRHKFYLSKILFVLLLSIGVGVILILTILGLDQLVLSMYEMQTIPLFHQTVLSKLIGTLFMVIFYSILSATGSFYFQSVSGGITFSLGIMFIPALVKLFPEGFSELFLSFLPEKSLSTLIKIGMFNLDNTILFSILVLLFWLLVPLIFGFKKFNETDF
ncbi:TPA: hypothetical protein IUW96_001059 [Enterococcus faecalis]|uniref:ABC-2 family transporter protein n=1 Tax=Atopostipes suicloacalis DSM 15692 TaxID=1121025 RepID=A0A1M4Z7C3_9LACT|nr:MULTISPECIES: hypothetical protein [Lactobacillales]EGO8342947.1 hypothetical protein [Enterococcus faecalis]EGO8343362.1 hypothetical protein [Enterococcus faecalis]EGO8777641.1 hypothetical protein [Enterococcus faecalis]EGO8777833.1 hypothetical protein [Enterococcus faecalis]EHL2448341.1 hypothetical protein [Enterococcus faecalis]